MHLEVLIMSRQYMSTFRQKLNPDNQQNLSKCGISFSSQPGSKQPPVSNDLMPQPSRTLTSNKETLKARTTKIDKHKASVAVKRSKVQVDMLESALAALRLKEKRALRELESEMRRYRKSIDANNKKARKTNVSRYSWNVQSLPLKNEDGVLRRGRNSDLQRSDQTVPNASQLLSQHQVQSNEYLKSHFDTGTSNETNENEDENQRLPGVREKTNDETITSERPPSNHSNKNGNNGRCKHKPSFSTEKQSKACNDYLGLLKDWSHKRVGKVYTKTERSSILKDKQESFPSSSSSSSSISNTVTNVKPKFTYSKGEKTLRVKDSATQFEKVYAANDDGNNQSSTPPKELWPSWFSENNKQVQTDSDIEPNFKPSHCIKQPQHASSSQPTTSIEVDSTFGSRNCKVAEDDEIEQLQSPKSGPHYARSKCSCAKSINFSEKHDQAFLTTCDELIGNDFEHKLNSTTKHLNDQSVSPYHAPLAEKEKNHLSCQQISLNQSNQENGGLIDDDQYCPHDFRKNNDCQQAGITENCSTYGNKTRYLQSAGMVKRDEMMQSRDKAQSPILQMNSIIAPPKQNREQRNSNHSPEKAKRWAKLSPIAAKNQHDHLAWNDPHHQHFPYCTASSLDYADKDRCSSVQQGASLSSSCHNLPRISGYCWSPVYYIENNRPNTARLLPIFNPPHQDIVLQVDLVDFSEKERASKFKGMAENQQRENMSPKQIQQRPFKLNRTINSIQSEEKVPEASADSTKATSEVTVKEEFQFHAAGSWKNVVLNPTKTRVSQKKTLPIGSDRFRFNTNHPKTKGKNTEKRFVRFLDDYDSASAKKRSGIMKQFCSWPQKEEDSPNLPHSASTTARNTNSLKLPAFSSTSSDQKYGEIWKQNLAKCQLNNTNKRELFARSSLPSKDDYKSVSVDSTRRYTSSLPQNRSARKLFQPIGSHSEEPKTPEKKARYRLSMKSYNEKAEISSKSYPSAPRVFGKMREPMAVIGKNYSCLPPSEKK